MQLICRLIDKIKGILSSLKFKRVPDYLDLLTIGMFDTKCLMLVRDNKAEGMFFVSQASTTDFRVKNRQEVVIVDDKGNTEDISNIKGVKLSQNKEGYQITYHILRKGRQYFVRAVATKLKKFYITHNIKLDSTSTFYIPTEGPKSKPLLLVEQDHKVDVYRLKTKRQLDLVDKEILTRRTDSHDGQYVYYDHFNASPIDIVSDKSNLFILYDATHVEGGNVILQVGGLMVPKNNPNYILWRSDLPIFEKTVSEEDYGEVEPLGVCVGEDSLNIYYTSTKRGVISFKTENPFVKSHFDDGKTPKLDKLDNPVISPSNNSWESHCTFNPTAILVDDKVHLLYRAQGDGLTVVGYAVSEDGIHFNERLDHPIYVPREDFGGNHTPKRVFGVKGNPSGGGWGGCEDARATVIDDRVYMIYTAFQRWEIQPRLVITSMSLDDFRERRWDKWTAPQFMTPEKYEWGQGSKSGALMPEKIKEQYVIFHRIWPNMCIDFTDSLDYSPEDKWIETKAVIPPHRGRWDGRKIGIGGAPLKTKHGWLVIYQGVGWVDGGKYKVGAMLLDLKDPTKVLYRTRQAILESTKWYEYDGAGPFTYPCGAVIKDGKIFVYYGAADKHVGVGFADLEEFIHKMKTEEDAIEINSVRIR